jgi:hypothetical protein
MTPQLNEECSAMPVTPSSSSRHADSFHVSPLAVAFVPSSSFALVEIERNSDPTGR